MNQKNTSKTAILVFANSSQEEVKHKAIVSGGVLFDALNAHTLKTVEKTGLPFFHFSEKNQIGNTFGERFTNAIQAVYDRGFERIITIGNDSPQLRPKHITEAENQLKGNKFVIGPTTDGGFYLMGLHKDQFDGNAFRQLDWQTSKLSQQLLHLVSNTMHVFRLPTLFDIDTVSDIKSFTSYAYHIPIKILQVLLNILLEGEKTSLPSILRIKNPHFRSPHNKGSPLLLQSA